MASVFRQAARLVVLDPDGCVLLFQYEDDGRTWWATPGGGLEVGETFEQAAAREAEEELPLGGSPLMPLWRQVSSFSFRGRRIRQEECFFLLRLAARPPFPDRRVKDAHTKEGILAARLWTPEQLDPAEEPVFPQNLLRRLRTIRKSFTANCAGRRGNVSTHACWTCSARRSSRPGTRPCLRCNAHGGTGPASASRIRRSSFEFHRWVQCIGSPSAFGGLNGWRRYSLLRARSVYNFRWGGDVAHWSRSWKRR